MKERTKTILIFVLLAVTAATLLLFEFAEVRLCADDKANALWCDIIPRLVTGAAATAVLFFLGYGKILLPVSKGSGRALLWCLPCLAVVLVNFPFSALIRGNAQVTRPDLIGLFALKCLSIGWMEEALFRGVLFCVIAEWQKDKKRGVMTTVILSSAIFALYHLCNLFSGAAVGTTLLQVGYSFLTGAMFAATYLRTKNIWSCVFFHALFDFGGLLIYDLGTGSVHDEVFWILTAIAGAICFVHVLRFLLRWEADPEKRSSDGKQESEE